MSPAEEERARVVAWLRGGAEFNGSLWDRVRGAWFILTRPQVVLFSFCLQVSDAIEAREHLKEQPE